MEDAIGLPELKEIETWLGDRCHVERVRLRNELAFIQGDCACGGPARGDLATALKSRLAAIAKRLGAIDSCHSHSDATGRHLASTLVSREPDEAAVVLELSIDKLRISPLSKGQAG